MTTTVVQAQLLSINGYHPEKFIENKGQWHRDIKFMLELQQTHILLGENKIGYILSNEEDLQALSHHPHLPDYEDSHPQKGKVSEPGMVRKHYVAMHFEGANEHVELSSKSSEVTNVNYLLGGDPTKWGVGIKPAEEVNYHNLYEGIDLNFQANEEGLKYEFIVAPNADPRQINMTFEGADQLFLKDGGLYISTSQGVFHENAPLVYQVIDGEQKTIRSRFKLKKNKVSIQLLDWYDRTKTLIIDPQLIFSSYSGSVADNWGNTACVDLEGNLYSGGTVFRDNGGTSLALTGFPTTPGAYRSSHQGGDTDMGILKFDSSGTQLLYATYLGGTRSEIPTSMVADDNGNLYILGVTSSTNFPTSLNAYDRTFNGGNTLCGIINRFDACFGSDYDLVGGYSFIGGTDLIITKLNNSGTAILSSTYMGGNRNDGVLVNNRPLTNNYGDQLRGDINLDANGNAYVSMSTSSSNFPTINAVQSTYGGGATDAVVFKLNSDLSTLIWSTFLGGSSDDAGISIILDEVENVYVGGGTISSNFPTTSGAYQENALGDVDGFVAYLDNASPTLIASTRLGTNAFDQTYFVQTDEAGFPYALGQSKGDFPIQGDVYSNPGSGVFIQKLSKDLTTSEWSTVIGSGRSTPDISPTAFLVNECGNIFLSGWGGGANVASSGITYNGGSTFGMPTTANAVQQTTDGSDFYLMALRKDADSLLYATFFGGNGAQEHVDGGTSRFDERGIIYQSVCASCGSQGYGRFVGDPRGLPISSNNVVSPVKRSFNCNNGVIKFDLASVIADFEVEDTCLSPVVLFKNKSVGGLKYYWFFGDGESLETSNKSQVTHVYKQRGKYEISFVATDFTTCKGSDTIKKTVYIAFPDDGRRFRDSVCVGSSIQLSVSPDPTGGLWKYEWSPSTYLDDPKSPTPIATPLSSIRYTVTITDTSGCVKDDILDLYVDRIYADFEAEITGDCLGEPKVCLINKSLGAEPKSFFWRSGSWVSSEREPCLSYPDYGKKEITLTTQNSYCGSADTNKTIQLEKVVIPNVFTPNGDNKNEAFYINGVVNTGDWEVEVFNRWGKQIFKSQQYQNNWDASGQSDGIYYYRVVSPQGTECKGWVEVIR